MTQRFLIAIVNCRTRQKSWADLIRKTWFPHVPSEKADVKFFVGRGEGSVPEDTVVLDCDDGYVGLPEKVRAIVRWAFHSGYSHVMKCDDDVVMNPKDVLDSDFWKYPYVGRANRRPNHHTPFWVPMGFAYWLNRRSMDIVARSPLPPNNDDERWVAERLYNNKIYLANDKRYHLYTGIITDSMLKDGNNRMIRRPLRQLHFDRSFGDMKVGFAWCVYFEPGGRDQTVPVEYKLAEFVKVWKLFGEITPIDKSEFDEKAFLGN